MPRNKTPRLRLVGGRTEIAKPRIQKFTPQTPGRSAQASARAKLYKVKRWTDLRFQKLSNPDFQTCFFCKTRPSTVLEHIIGHGDDALDVAEAFGWPRSAFADTWQERFWRGPFAGSCSKCAHERTGYEVHGRLLEWTKRHLEGKT